MRPKTKLSIKDRLINEPSYLVGFFVIILLITMFAFIFLALKKDLSRSKECRITCYSKGLPKYRYIGKHCFCYNNDKLEKAY